MVDMVYWPRAVLIPRSSAINPAPATVAGVASLSGFRQAVASPAGVWSIRYDGIPVGSVGQRLIARALAAQVEGRATPIVLPVFDLEELRPLGTTTAAESPYGDDAEHSDDTPFASLRVQVIAAAVADLGATSITVETILGAALSPGQHFSVGHRLYRVRRVDLVAGVETLFSFWPPTREAIPEGAELNFDEPVCKVRLERDGGLDVMLQMGAHGVVSIDFIEDPT